MRRRVTLSRNLTRAVFTDDANGKRYADESVDPAYRDPQLLRSWVLTMQDMGYAVAMELPSPSAGETAARLLETAAGLVALGWTTGANARYADGTPCSPEQPAAACWCAMGSMTAASHLMGIHTQTGDYVDLNVPTRDYVKRLRIQTKARYALRKAIAEGRHPSSLSATSVTLCISNWNDDEAEDGGEVSRTMVRAAAILRQEAA